MRKAVVAVLAALLFFSSGLAQENKAGLTWDQVVGANAYVIFSGPASLDYSYEEVTVNGGVPPATYGLTAPEGMIVYAAIKAENDAGRSQDYSNEVYGWPNSEHAQTYSDCDPMPGGLGATCVAYVAGFNFAPQVRADIIYDGVLVTNVTRVDSRSLQIEYEIAPDAAGGIATLRIENTWWSTVQGTDDTLGGYVGVSVPGAVTVTAIVLPGTVGGLRRIDVQ